MTETIYLSPTYCRNYKTMWSCDCSQASVMPVMDTMKGFYTFWWDHCLDVSVKWSKIK